MSAGIETAPTLPARIREAAQLAIDLSEETGEGEARAEALLARTLELARGLDDGHTIWALLTLTDRRKRAGDLPAGHLGDAAHRLDRGVESGQPVGSRTISRTLSCTLAGRMSARV